MTRRLPRRWRPPSPTDTPQMTTTGVDNTVTIVTSSSAEVTIYWGDGTHTSKTGALQSSAHTYSDGLGSHAIRVVGGETLTYFDCNNNLLTSLRLPPEWTSITSFNCADNSLPNIVLPPEWTAVELFYCYGNGWNEAATDALLAAIESNLASLPATGDWRMHTTNAAPSNPAGWASYDVIVAAKPAWTLLVSGVHP
jgi:Leucine-rich repeat (LRR) protein